MRTITSLSLSSINLLKLKTINYFQYAQWRSQFKQKSRQHRQYQNQPKQQFRHLIDPKYFEDTIHKIQPSAGHVINVLLNNKSSRKQIFRELQLYLQFRNTTFTPNLRTDLGCVAVLVGINNVNVEHQQNLQQYINRIVDFVTLSDVDNSQYDSTMIKYLLLAIHKRSNMNIQKNIRQYYRLKLVEIGLDNFERIDDKDLIQLIIIIQESFERDKLNFITKWRFFPLFQAIVARVTKIMQKYLQTKQYEVMQSIDHIITKQFYYKFIHLVYFYGNILASQAQIICSYIIKKQKSKHQDFHFMNNLLNTLCYIPYVEVVNQQSNQITLIRKQLLDYFEQRFNQSSFCRKSWNDFHISTKKFTVQRFFQDYFHKTFKSLNFQHINTKYIGLKKQHLIRPQIPQFIWRLYKDNQKMFTDKIILGNIISKLYPQKVSLAKQKIADYSSRKLTAFSDNQANLKIWQALNNLGYEYKKQQICVDRQVDLLIDENIILQVDGQGHYNFLTNELGPDTSFRNLHLLLSGYKLVIISMFEYNNNRQTDKLQELIKQKFELVKNQNYIYVC